jgi:hypothetical protein
MALLVQWHGDRELDAADLVLSELHLGATYGAVVGRRLWRSMPVDVVLVPLAITAATYVLMLGDRSIVVTTAVMYLAAWHRGRQNYGIARYYQIQKDGPLSASHQRFFRAAIYLPMLAGVAYFTNTSPLHEGEEYLGLAIGHGAIYALAMAAVASIVAYGAFTARHRDRIHPGEWWLVMTNAVAFGSAYALGAWSVSFILVLTVHHEVQYLYFTYAMARRSAGPRLGGLRGESRLMGSFAIWPIFGLASWAMCQQSEAAWLPPFLVSGLLCHYWLDARIWTSRARRQVG